MEIRHLDLFSGIGGFALGLRQASADFRTIAFCEINPYAQEVLRKNFARTPILHDVSTLNGSEYESDLITAGFPCQDLSIAGKQRGLEGQRSGLFYQTLRIADESQARIILYENSPELIRRDHFREAFVTSLQERGWGVVWRICSAREFLARYTREKESMHYALGKKLLPPPIASDAFALQRFTISTQMATHKNHQKRLYPYIVVLRARAGGRLWT